MSSPSPLFLLDKRHDFAVARIPRCGSQTIGNWLGQDAIPVQLNDPRLFDVSRRVAFIRNPLERLKSAYSLFYWLNDYEVKPKNRGIPIGSWDEFVDHILVNEEIHWTQQTTLVEDVPNVYHRFENIIDHFEKYRPGIFPHNNWTSRRPTVDYRMDEINEKYSQDLKLWEHIE